MIKIEFFLTYKAKKPHVKNLCNDDCLIVMSWTNPRDR